MSLTKRTDMPRTSPAHHIEIPLDSTSEPRDQWHREPNKMRRRVFTIHPDYRIGVSSDKNEHPSKESSVRFASESDLGRLTAKWPAQRLVEIWNQLPSVNPVSRFTDRTTAVRRIWAKIQGMAPPEKPPAPNTKAEQIVALLKGPSGASLQAIMELTGWQPHSVRGFISAQISKRMGLKIRSFKRDGERIYRIQP